MRTLRIMHRFLTRRNINGKCSKRFLGKAKYRKEWIYSALKINTGAFMKRLQRNTVTYKYLQYILYTLFSL